MNFPIQKVNARVKSTQRVIFHVRESVNRLSSISLFIYSDSMSTSFLMRNSCSIFNECYCYCYVWRLMLFLFKLPFVLENSELFQIELLNFVGFIKCHPNTVNPAKILTFASSELNVVWVNQCIKLIEKSP